jgi:hypothetical protein
VLADRQLTHRGAATGADTIVENIRLNAAPLHANAKSLQLRIPEHGLAPAARRPQRIDRALCDLAAHRLAPRSVRLGLGIT